MELNELTHDERLALVALVEVVVSSDTEVSASEERQIGNLAAAFGDDAYRALVDEADERFADEDALKQFLTGITRQDARDLIYGTVLDSALPDVIDTHESSLLGWLATTWGVTVQYDTPDA